MDLAEIWPPFGLRISCGNLTLRPTRDADLPALVDLALGGVEAKGLNLQPFLRAWHRAEPAAMAESMARFHWTTRSNCKPESWHLIFVVDINGDIVGVQDMIGRQFPITRVASTGSWLGNKFHRQGIGTRMRQAIAAFGFDYLGAEEMHTEYVEGNAASLGVSTKVGYQFSHRVRTAREDGWAYSDCLVLTPDTFNRAAEPVEVVGLDAFRCFLGLDPATPESTKPQ